MKGGRARRTYVRISSSTRATAKGSGTFSPSVGRGRVSSHTAVAWPIEIETGARADCVSPWSRGPGRGRHRGYHRRSACARRKRGEGRRQRDDTRRAASREARRRRRAAAYTGEKSGPIASHRAGSDLESQSSRQAVIRECRRSQRAHAAWLGSRGRRRT